MTSWRDTAPHEDDTGWDGTRRDGIRCGVVHQNDCTFCASVFSHKKAWFCIAPSPPRLHFFHSVLCFFLKIHYFSAPSPKQLRPRSFPGLWGNEAFLGRMPRCPKRLGEEAPRRYHVRELHHMARPLCLHRADGHVSSKCSVVGYRFIADLPRVVFFTSFLLLTLCTKTIFMLFVYNVLVLVCRTFGYDFVWVSCMAERFFVLKMLKNTSTRSNCHGAGYRQQYHGARWCFV